jgi:hypothetical protein
LERRHLLADTVCWLLLTPLAIASCILCVQGAIYYADDANELQVHVPALLGLAVFIGLAYIVWLAVSVRAHTRHVRYV